MYLSNARLRGHHVQNGRSVAVVRFDVVCQVLQTIVLAGVPPSWRTAYGSHFWGDITRAALKIDNLYGNLGYYCNP